MHFCYDIPLSWEYRRECRINGGKRCIMLWLRPKKEKTSLIQAVEKIEKCALLAHHVFAYVYVLIINSFSRVPAIEYTHETRTTRIELDDIPPQFVTEFQIEIKNTKKKINNRNTMKNYQFSQRTIVHAPK